MSTLKLVAFAGSTRKGSYNQAVASHAAEAAGRSGAEVNLLNLAEYPMPIYNGDLEEEEGIPATAIAVKRIFSGSDGFIISSPEYNSAFSPLMKNVIDWASRSETDDEPSLSAYRGKSALLLSASPGALGGLRGLYTLRTLLQNIGVTVYPEMLSVRSAYEAIDGDGKVSDEKWASKIDKLVESYVAFAGKLKG